MEFEFIFGYDVFRNFLTVDKLWAPSSVKGAPYGVTTNLVKFKLASKVVSQPLTDPDPFQTLFPSCCYLPPRLLLLLSPTHTVFTCGPLRDATLKGLINRALAIWPAVPV